MLDTIACASVTLIGVLIALWYYHNQLRHERLSNLSSIVSIERSLAEIKSAYRFHGITDADIENAKITHEELAYLVANFTAGRIFDTGEYRNKKPFSHTNYRYKMLEQESTRRAWPLILRMMTEDGYIKKLTKTKEKIERNLRHVDTICLIVPLSEEKRS